jgi:hypothetical protein
MFSALKRIKLSKGYLAAFNGSLPYDRQQGVLWVAEAHQFGNAVVTKAGTTASYTRL